MRSADMVDEERRVEAKDHAPDSEAVDSLSALVPKRRLWPVFAFLGAILALVGFFVFRHVTSTDPLKILVAIDLDGYWWEGSEPAAKLADELAASLSELGFEPVKGGDPKVMKALEQAKDPREAAKKLGAAFVIEAKLAPEVVEHPIKGGYFELRVDAPVTLTYFSSTLDKVGTSSEGRIRGYSGAVKKDRAVSILSESMASQALDAVVAQLIDHPVVKELTNGSNVKLVEKLDPAKIYAKQREGKLKTATDACAFRAKERENEDQGRVTYHSHAAAEDLLVGVAEGGYFVKTADVVPLYSLKRRDLLRSEALETVEFRPFEQKDASSLDPKAQKPLWKGYHVYSYPSSDAGGRVALVEDLFGWAKTITVVDKAGNAKRVRIDPEHRFVDPKISPGGKFVAVYDRASPDSPADLMVLDLESGKELFGFHTENHSLGGFTWLDAARVAFWYEPTELKDDKGKKPDPKEAEAGVPLHLAVADVSKQPFTLSHPFRAKYGQSYSMPRASADGKKLVCVHHGDEPGLAVIDATTWEVKTFPVGWAGWPRFSPDGAHVVFEKRGGGDNEISVLTLATGAVKQLTNNKSDDRLPQFSADGKRVFFEARDKDPMFPRSRGLSRVASVAFEP